MTEPTQEEMLVFSAREIVRTCINRKPYTKLTGIEYRYVMQHGNKELKELINSVARETLRNTFWNVSSSNKRGSIE